MSIITISDFFWLNGIEKIVDQESILAVIGARVPSHLWSHVQLTEAQRTLLGKMHGYVVEETLHPDLTNDAR
jgi:hypothetical protein